VSRSRSRLPILLVAVLATIGAPLTGSTILSAAVVTVVCPPDDLQAAISAAAPGDTLLISGTCQGDFTVNKDLTLIGSPAATLLAPPATGPVLDVNGGIVVLQNLTITGADDTDDGGAIQNDGTLTIESSTLTGNRADNGGGVFNGGTLTVIGSTISGNHAEFDGGGIDHGNGTATILNSTISGSTANRDGGGIKSSAPIVLTNVTVSGNAANADSSGGGTGGGLARTGGMAALTIRNSLVAGNANPTAEPDCKGTITSGGGNLVGNVSAGCTFIPMPNDQTGTSAAPLDAKLGPLGSNGGPTQTHPIAADSPAIDAADPALAPPLDQRGVPRSPDVGAYEYAECQGTVVNVVGTDGDDVLGGTPGPDGVLAFAGDDRIDTGDGDDAVCAGEGNDVVRAGAGDDRVLGEGGDDVLLGQGGNDVLKGGAGRDRIKGGAGGDKVNGQGRPDIVLGQGGADKVRGGGGPDKAKGGAGDDVVAGGGGGDVLRGGAGDDKVKGQGGPDRLFGHGGDDKLLGGPGVDACDGGSGANTLVGCEE